MAIGDEAKSAGYAIVPDTGEEGRVRWGARELNRTRDYVAAVRRMIPGGKRDLRNSSGITTGTNIPADREGEDGDIHFRVIA